jgi:hypothetical protein
MKLFLILLLCGSALAAKQPKTYDLTVKVIESAAVQKIPAVAHGSTDCTPDTNGGMDCDASTRIGYEAAQASVVIQNMQYQIECSSLPNPFMIGPMAYVAAARAKNGCLLTPGDYKGRWDKSVLKLKVKLIDGKWKEVPFRVVGMKKVQP